MPGLSTKDLRDKQLIVLFNGLYRFCPGMLSSVMVVLMAADAGLISMDKEVMAIGGTSEGADTCIVIKPAYSRKFFDLEIREIVAKPRSLVKLPN